MLLCWFDLKVKSAGIEDEKKIQAGWVNFGVRVSLVGSYKRNLHFHMIRIHGMMKGFFGLRFFQIRPQLTTHYQS